MSDPARKRRNLGLPHWRQHPRNAHAPPPSSSDSIGGFAAYSGRTGILQSVSSASAAPELPSHQHVDATTTSWTNQLLFPGNQSDFFALDLSAAELVPSSLGSLSSLPSLDLEYDAHTGLDGMAPTATVPLAADDPWPNVTCFTGDLLSTSAGDTDGFLDLPLEDIWRDTSLYRLEGGVYLEPLPRVAAADAPRPRKRDFDQLSNVPSSIAGPSSTTDAFLRVAVPSLFPSVPDMRSRPPHAIVANPFLESSENRLPTLANRVRPLIPENGVIDGYIKTRMSTIEDDDEDNATNRSLRAFRPQRRELVINPDGAGLLSGVAIPFLPPNFSTGMKLDKTDEKLWCFHINAYCPGRTLLPSNFWSQQVAAVAVKDDCARHALLAFTTAYVLDYVPTEEMRKRANRHYRTAVQLLDQALKHQDTYSVGKEDSVVVSMILILSNDIVNWESRRPKGREPLWREGSRAARLLLDRTDPGYRYWKPQNVQSSIARIGNANWIAYTDICAQPVTPLIEENAQNLFPWLLEGSKHDVHKIQDVTGVCPKLLHIFSQITHLAALLKKDRESTVVPLAALRIRDRLANFWQWSDTSMGYASANELMESCLLNDDGKVEDSIKVTELSAQAWVPAAEMYLHFRVYRKPRSHPHVVRSLNALIQCIKRMPCKGSLFTSQSPFFPVFMMAIASYREEDRKVGREWFEVVLHGAQCRSSVPPVWTAIQNLWQWLDDELIDQPYDEDQPLGERRAWWEEMVDELVKESGVLSLV